MIISFFLTAIQRSRPAARTYVSRNSLFSSLTRFALDVRQLATSQRPTMSDSESSQGFVLDDSESDAFMAPVKETKAKKSAAAKKPSLASKVGQVHAVLT